MLEYVGAVAYSRMENRVGVFSEAVMDRAPFEAVREKSLAQWSHRTIVRNKSDHLLSGVLFDDAGHRMIPTHATKAGIRYRYYVSLPLLHGESKSASVGSVSRISAAGIEETIIKAVNQHLLTQNEKPSSGSAQVGDRKFVLEHVARIDVNTNCLTVRLRSEDGEEMVNSATGLSLSIPWQKPSSRKSRQILVPHGVAPNEVRPTRIERRARLVNAIARGRRWLDEIVSGSVTDVQQIAARQKCSVRQVNMTISLAFLAPDLVRAAVEGRLPRGLGVERLRDAPAEWNRQFEALGLKPE